MLRSRPLAVVSAAAAATSTLIALHRRIQRSRQTAGAVPVAQARAEEEKATVEYLRHMYAMTRAWYTAAETKAQLLLAVNGLFVTILFGILFGNSGTGTWELPDLGLGRGSCLASLLWRL